jgi:hypothetical protein
VSLGARFANVRLRVGSKITVAVTKPNSIGAVKILTVRSGKIPTISDRCLPPGSNKPQRRCGGEG